VKKIVAKKKKTRVIHHIIYALPERKKRQGDLTIPLTHGAHTVITDVQYSIARDDMNAGLCLIFEGMKRVIQCLQKP